MMLLPFNLFIVFVDVQWSTILKSKENMTLSETYLNIQIEFSYYKLTRNSLSSNKTTDIIK